MASDESQQNYGVFRRRRPIRLARARSSVADVGGSWTPNAAIQRAPSRLYRLHDQSMDSPSSFQPRKSQSFRDLNRELSVTEKRTSPSVGKEPESAPSCSGPEFIVKSSLVPYTLTLPHQPKKVHFLID